MSATLTPPTRPLRELGPGPAASIAEATPAGAEPADPDAAEAHRWIVGLGTPFVLGAVFFALSIGWAQWLIAPAIVFGPLLFVFMTLYLCLTTDSNDAPYSHA
jgi:hypothetical protein